jgi:hypothetical protein
MTKRNPYPHKTINGKKAPMHRHIIEEHIGRELEPLEHVYHLNGNSKDNRIENLTIIRKKSWNPNK